MTAPTPLRPDWIEELAGKQDVLRARAKLIAGIRAFFDQQDFIEVHTPRLVSSPGLEPYLDVFETSLAPPRDEGPIRPVWLPTSPEFAMKKLLAAGYRRIYDLGVCFRNAEGSHLHEPEFLMLEWYRAGGDEHELMDDCQALFLAAAAAAGLPPRAMREGKTIPLDVPWRRVSFRALFSEAGIDLAAAIDHDDLAARSIAAGHAGVVEPADDFETAFYRLFLTLMEPRLGFDAPALVYGYPASMAAYARLDDADPRFARRFELYIGGVELANAFYEVTDPAVQRLRWQEHHACRRALGKPPLPEDPVFLNALEAGMPASAGIALGVDRMAMLLLGLPSIQDALPFYRWKAPADTAYEES